jgi:hypothetical protein
MYLLEGVLQYIGFLLLDGIPKNGLPRFASEQDHFLHTGFQIHNNFVLNTLELPILTPLQPQLFRYLGSKPKIIDYCPD